MLQSQQLQSYGPTHLDEGLYCMYIAPAIYIPLAIRQFCEILTNSGGLQLHRVHFLLSVRTAISILRHEIVVG